MDKDSKKCKKYWLNLREKWKKKIFFRNDSKYKVFNG